MKNLVELLSEKENQERFVLAAVGINYDELKQEIDVAKDEKLHNLLIVQYVLDYLRTTSKVDYIIASYTDLAKLADRTEDEIAVILNDFVYNKYDEYGLSLVKKENNNNIVKLDCTGKYKINDPVSKVRLDTAKTEEFHDAIKIYKTVKYITANKKNEKLDITFSVERLSFLTGIDQNHIAAACENAEHLFNIKIPGWKFN